MLQTVFCKVAVPIDASVWLEFYSTFIVKYYTLNERADGIWIVIISAPVEENGTLPCYRAEELALELGYSPEEGSKFMHEYIFQWGIKDQCVEHTVSVETLLDCGLDLDSCLQNDRLPNLRVFRGLMMDMILDHPLDGYSGGRRSDGTVLWCQSSCERNCE